MHLLQKNASCRTPHPFLYRNMEHDFINTLLTILNQMSPYILLGFLFAGIIYAFVPRTAMARHLSGTGWKPVVKAAAIGVPLPLCSCGVLPTAISMRRNGASNAASTSFLLATPQTGVDSIAATWSLLGPAFAVIRPVAAFLTAIFGGLLVGRNERKSPTVSNMPQVSCDTTDKPPHGVDRIIAALRYGFVDLVASIGRWLVIGLIVAAVITAWIPDGYFGMLGSNPLVAMLLVLILAIPMYICATGSIPIALSLILKGLSPGAAFVMLMAGPAVNVASFALIKKEMGRSTTLCYLASVILGAISFGLLIDYVLPTHWFDIGTRTMTASCHAHSISIFDTACSAVLVALLIFAAVRPHFTNKTKTTTMTQKYIIKGMNCTHCRDSVTKAIAAVPGVTEVTVSLSEGTAQVAGTADRDAVIKAVHDAGFDAE